MNVLAITAVAGIMIAGAGYLAMEEFGVLNSPQCHGDAVLAPTSGPADKHVRLTVQNNATDEDIRVCLLDAQGTVLFDQTIAATGETGRYWDLYPATKVDHFVAKPAGSKGSDLGQLEPWVTCSDGLVPELLYARGWRLIAADCGWDELPPMQRAKASTQTMSILPGPAESPGPPMGGVAAAGILGAGLGVLGLVCFRDPLRWFFLGLFTRLVTPKLLDQTTRNQIHQLVQSEPGIRGSEIAQRLELANGQTIHHLRVLVRGHVLAVSGRGASRHYFVRGQYSPQRMQQLSTLRLSGAAAIHRAVLQRPGAALSEVAGGANISRPHASRIVRELAKVGLVRSDRHGRHVRIFPLG